jgi:hypothetical protein
MFIVCGNKHLMRTKLDALPAQGLPNTIQPAVLRLFINGFASQKEQNPFNCFKIALSFSVKIPFQRLNYFSLGQYATSRKVAGSRHDKVT